MKATFTLAALLCACAASAQAQQVYRCGNAYSQQPCEGAAVVKVDDARSAQQSAAAAMQVKRDATAADAMEKSRQQLEAKASPATVIQQARAEPEKRAGNDERKKPKKLGAKKPDYFSAVGPKPVKAKKAAGKSA